MAYFKLLKNVRLEDSTPFVWTYYAFLHVSPLTILGDVVCNLHLSFIRWEGCQFTPIFGECFWLVLWSLFHDWIDITLTSIHLISLHGGLESCSLRCIMRVSHLFHHFSGWSINTKFFGVILSFHFSFSLLFSSYQSTEYFFVWRFCAFVYNYSVENID